MRERAYANQNNTPLDLAHLREILDRTRDLPGSTPVHLAGDEEGNGFGALWQIDVTSAGLILWPAGNITENL